ncbi:DMT family transporter [Actinobacteria bacterium YIM 96077]|uniref:EamA family transporter n=1 Tax=Phytoactinopolyspora halophila TaxID=1981511 RepID=A0A329R0W6_9ACTN|nr:DMT family transporter [Phytoactinopolyspora halophila]AYY11740.1 DMT family transporter [Actinobacteria bacterium YIM 96077]RAW17826.1 EamA family transporter [Phytoactinopolyspora halophila]
MTVATPHSRPLSNTATGSLTCTAAMTIVGTSIAVAPWLADYPVLSGQAWRYLLAGLLLLLVLIARPTLTGVSRSTVRPLRKVSPGTVLALVALAATGLAAFNWLLIEGTRHADPAFMASMVGATPLVLALLGPWTSGLPLRLRTVIGSAIVMTGILLVHGATAAPLAALPYGLGFLACEVAFTLLAVPVLKELTPLQLSTAVCFLAVPMLAAVSIAHPAPSLQIPTGTEALALLYMAVLTTAVAFLLWYSGVARLGADRAGLFCGVMPIASYLAGLALGSSVWAIPALTGVVLCGLGIVTGLSPGERPGTP